MRRNSVQRTFVSSKKVESTPTTTMFFAVDCLPRQEKFASTHWRWSPSKNPNCRKKQTRTSAVEPKATPRKSFVRRCLRRLSTRQGYGGFLALGSCVPYPFSRPAKGGGA